MFRHRPGKVFGRLVSWALIEGRPLTTGGRWINPLVFGLYRAAQANPIKEDSDRPIYIIGTGRSGTTVLGTLFAMHMDAVFLNEPKALWHYVHGEEDIIGSYSEGEARVRLGAEEASPTMARAIAKVYSWAMRVAGARRVVDKYPELVFRMPFVLGLFPKAKCVAILRDGVDTCSSVTQWSKRKGEVQGAEVHDWWGRDGRKWSMLVEQIVPAHEDLAPLKNQLLKCDDHRDRSAVEWIVSMRAAMAAGEQFPDAVQAITYEDLCNHPDQTLDRILAHTGLRDDAKFRGYARSVLSPAAPYGTLALMPELVEPFCQMLVAMGYGESVGRVSARTDK
ncbi:sulfotransferase [Qipengyuania sp. XHP0211]|uniref:sulfotransferase family protein n=1 Tax=Qipengyuania sp. XHP0211 TaxID=3038079 RepID=UPI00241F19C1|nr:sulfotransferase [Qipengyuania sp. XHP0211]MDG5750964.1 sulfotransferase [Qipengyuania sp. XHP0211]